MAVTLSSRLEIPRARFKEKNKVVNDGSALSTNSIHSHDEDNAQGQGYNIKSSWLPFSLYMFYVIEVQKLKQIVNANKNKKYETQ